MSFRGDFFIWKSSSVLPPPAEAQRAKLGKQNQIFQPHRRADSTSPTGETRVRVRRRPSTTTA
ncbi:hypothetical protein HPP92_017409 [Vanilla planifolia]|uniref:Uncharacterized protein n=1 Tax=Vanilla planifolia TaxID=51239 RepID=A0A835UPD8_VANPL|nr:hypothetical protein HPP92_017409 [Vanilla planifolia]